MASVEKTSKSSASLAAVKSSASLSCCSACQSAFDAWDFAAHRGVINLIEGTLAKPECGLCGEMFVSCLVSRNIPKSRLLEERFNVQYMKTYARNPGDPALDVSMTLAGLEMRGNNEFRGLWVEPYVRKLWASL